jgi:GNAT superfamily N-acetyltransferase
VATATQAGQPGGPNKDGNTTTNGVAQLLAVAFAHDPLSAVLAADPGRRANILPWFFRACVRHAQAHGGVVTRPGGAALWLSGQFGPDVVQGFSCGMGGLPWRVGLGATARLLRHEACGHRLLHDSGVTTFGYLWFAGVTPDARGQGLARHLVEDVLAAQAERGHHTCLLTTESAQNVTIWSRTGFVVAGHHPRTPAGLPIWLMRRSVP